MDEIDRHHAEAIGRQYRAARNDDEERRIVGEQLRAARSQWPRSGPQARAWREFLALAKISERTARRLMLLPPPTRPAEFGVLDAYWRIGRMQRKDIVTVIELALRGLGLDDLMHVRAQLDNAVERAQRRRAGRRLSGTAVIPVISVSPPVSVIPVVSVSPPASAVAETTATAADLTARQSLRPVGYVAPSAAPSGEPRPPARTRWELLEIDDDEQ